MTKDSGAAPIFHQECFGIQCYQTFMWPGIKTAGCGDHLLLPLNKHFWLPENHAIDILTFFEILST